MPNRSTALDCLANIDQAAAVVTAGTAMFSPEDLAGQYAADAAKQAGHTTQRDLIAQLECLADAGAVFDHTAALAAALAAMPARFATVDIASGFVWWIGDAEDPADACARSHAETGNTTAEFVECRGTDGATYAVHEVPAGFDVEDGQQAAAIAATEAHPFAGYFRQA